MGTGSKQSKLTVASLVVGREQSNLTYNSAN